MLNSRVPFHPAAARPPRWKLILAYGAIYFLWGTTFLAIRVGVTQAPPFAFAAARMTAAGAILFALARLRGARAPKPREWAGAAAVGALMFALDYSCLFWGETRVPSGLTAVIMATIPVVIAAEELLVLRTRRPTGAAAAGLAAGVLGVAVLTSSRLSLGEAPVDRLGALVLLLGALSWATGTLLSREVPRPPSEAMSAAAQMLCGGVLLLAVSAAAGQSPARLAGMAAGGWLSMGYLVVFGSIVGFTAYTWLLAHEPPGQVATYAYVNPVVAVLVGHAALSEPLGPRVVTGTALVLAAVAAIRLPAGRRRPAPGAPPTAQA